jgi:hypothetical protein
MSGFVHHKTAMYRLITWKSRRTCLLASARWMSSRPYKFHVGASWAGKPTEWGPKRLHIPFAPESVIGSWRDETLSRPKAVPSRDAGEDFFYVQEVSLTCHDLSSGAHARCVKMRNGSVSGLYARAR